MTQAEKFVKIQSLQSRDFSPANNIVDFVVPTGTYDLSNSYVSITILPNISPFDVDGVQGGLIPYVLSNTGLKNFESVMNGIFVKNASMTSDRVGRLEDIRNTNIIHYDLWQRTKSFEEKVSYNQLSLSPIPSPFNIVQMAGLKMNKEGTTPSDFNTPFEIQVPINEFLRLGTMTQFNTAKLGDLRIRLELDTNFRPTTYMVSDANTEIDKDLAFGGALNRVMQPVAANTASASVITTVQPLGLPNRSPYFVSQAIQVNLVGTGIGSETLEAIILGISKNADDTLELTISKPIPTTGAAETFTVSVSGLDAPGDYLGDFSINTAELRLKKIPDVPMDELTYFTITNESDNGTLLTPYRTQYYLEPECVAFSMIHTLESDSLVNRSGGMTSYRIVLDNNDIMGNRDITVNNPLEHELLLKTLLNLGLPVKSFENQQTYTNDLYGGQVGTSGALPTTTTFIGAPTPQTQNRKVLDLSMTRTGGVRNLQLFKFVVKNIKL